MRSRAFHVWYRCGQSLTRTLKGLEDEGYSAPTRQTLAAWRDEDGWIERAANLDALQQAAMDALLLTEDEQLLASLKKHKEKYESYFDSLKKPDPQATYAYNGLLKTLQETAHKTVAYKRAVFIEFYRDMSEYIRKVNTELADDVEKEFDGYMGHIKAKLV